MSSHNKFQLSQQGELQAALELIVGENQGQSYDLSSHSTLIGRGDDNHLVISSASVSRNHARIDRNEAGQFVIRDNGSKNGIQINGEPIEEKVLKPGDVVQLGDYVFRFNVAHAEASSSQAPIPSGPSGGAALNYGEKPKPKANKRPLVYGALALALVLVYYLQSSDSGTSTTDAAKGKDDYLTQVMGAEPKRPNLPLLRTKDLSAADDPVYTREENALSKIDVTDSGAKSAEQFFKLGRREYLSDNYGRAIEFFETALSFNQRHSLSKSYLQLTKFKAERTARDHFRTARKYFEALQYQRAIHHFRQVVSLLSFRPNDKIVEESQKYISIGRKKVQVEELFP